MLYHTHINMCIHLMIFIYIHWYIWIYAFIYYATRAVQKVLSLTQKEVITEQFLLWQYTTSFKIRKTNSDFLVFGITLVYITTYIFSCYSSKVYIYKFIDTCILYTFSPPIPCILCI